MVKRSFSLIKGQNYSFMSEKTYYCDLHAISYYVGPMKMCLSKCFRKINIFSIKKRTGLCKNKEMRPVYTIGW